MPISWKFAILRRRFFIPIKEKFPFLFCGIKFFTNFAT